MSTLNVSVAYSGPEWSGEISVRVVVGATVSDAIAESGIEQHIKTVAVATLACGVWGKVRARDYVLREGDRVEIYRPLQADPKEARRAKAASAGTKKHSA